MTLGGLKEGVTPLEMAYAYSTIANHGVQVSGIAGVLPRAGPVAIEKVDGAGRDDKNERTTERVFPAKRRPRPPRSCWPAWCSGGTGKAAQIGEFAAGKTGTTENYGDAWFVGFNKRADRGRLGRLPRQAAVHEDRVPRRRRWPAAPSPPRSGTTS